MLVLSRKKNERILLGDTITIDVLRCRGDQVRLGITAPPEMKIMREEIVRRMSSGEEWSKIEDALDSAENQ